MPPPRTIRWPDGKRFAFTIVDDTDHATVQRIEPIYDLLTELKLFTTKTAWAFPTEAGAHYENAQTLADDDYRAFLLDLQQRGFEIALHGARGCSSNRETVVAALDRFRDVFGRDPAIHVNHAFNLDNLYWGRARLSPIRRALRLYRGNPGDSFGHVHRSPHFWGDLARKRIRYVRAGVFRDINTLKRDPFMPYRDPAFPLVNAWFSASDGANVARLVSLISSPNQERLQREGGLCIVYTHFAARGFVDGDGRVNAELKRLLAELSRRDGWFRPAGRILDHLARDGITTRGHRARVALALNRWLRR